MTFIVGEFCTRNDINAALGGEKVAYLPQSGGRIVAGCFSRDKNPDAPEEIQVGVGHVRIRKCLTLENQERPCVPVFLKHRSNQWQYRGEWGFAELSNSRAEIEAAEAKSGRHGDVSYLLKLRPVVAPPAA